MRNMKVAVAGEGSPFHPGTLKGEEWAQLNEAERAFLLGIWAYAWWQNGTPMVGSTGRTFREAVDNAMREWGKR